MGQQLRYSRTVVEVNDLFYNLPARRKFLKSDGAESAQVSRIVTQLALAYPEVGFTLTSAARTVLQAPPAASPRDRLYQIYGERDDLMEVRKEAGGMRIAGFIAALSRGWAPLDACRFATATAALVAQGLGTLGKLQSFADTETAMAESRPAS